MVEMRDGNERVIENARACDEPPISVIAAGVHGIPCVFEGCRGAFHSAAGPVGVVLCPSWGFEDLVMRTSWRLLAETVAAAGFPVLRFDYPGTGDSLGAMTDIVEAAQWTRAIGDAAESLRAYTGVTRLAFIGQSLGVALAAQAAAARTDVAALLLIAPVVKGRAYVRELAVTSSLVADKLGITADLAPGEGLSVLGFSLSASLVESLKALDLTKCGMGGVQSVTVYDQADRKQAAEVLKHFRRNGVAARLKAIAPYHLMVSDATVIQPLPASAAQIVAALRELFPRGPCAVTLRVPPLPATLRAETFREKTLRFGPADALHGTLCQPAQPQAGAPVYVFLNRGLNAQVGWRRISVDHARALAAAGIASLRIDFAGLGESANHSERPAPSVYSVELISDVCAAVDALAAAGYVRIGLVGVCSGAFTALGAAEADPRVTDVVVVNTQRLVWNPAETLEDVLRYDLRSVSDYVGDIKTRKLLRKLLRGRERVVPKLWFLAKRGIADAIARLPLSTRFALQRESLAGRVQRLFLVLSRRGTRVSLVYSDRDPGLRELRSYYGHLGRNLRLPGMTVTIIPDADHNLTTTRASNWLLAHLIAFAGCAERAPGLAVVAEPALPEPTRFRAGQTKLGPA